MRWCFGVSAGGQLPDSHKPGTDGVGSSGKGPGEASWTIAQCGDCLSVQALGHTATPRWARAPALGFQRDVIGGCVEGAGFPSSLQDPIDSPPPPPQTVLYSHFLYTPQMLLQELFCFNLEPFHTLLFPPLPYYILEKKGGRLSCYTAPICPMSFHAVDHDAAAWLSGCRKDFGKWTEAFKQPCLCTLPVSHSTH
ncbi:hypothetical protein ILYODFUR_005999 [Ilyodon furcidens]|uniref:Uncharacterized protein n=1 Tax=Ilyodon furcidens TaxID=33524 RepID=A0ABV0UQY8_9TELE